MSEQESQDLAKAVVNGIIRKAVIEAEKSTFKKDTKTKGRL